MLYFKIIGIFPGAYGLQQSMFTVDGGHRAIMFNRIGGIQDYALTEGLHFRIPWFQVYRQVEKLSDILCSNLCLFVCTPGPRKCS